MQKVKFSPEPQKLKEIVRRLSRVRIQLTRRQWIVAVAALAAVAALLIWLLRPQTQQPVYPIVAVEPVTTDNVNIYGEYVGRIRAQQFVEVHARVEGYLEQMLFAEGTHVNKGQTLFVIDPKLYRARANRARAQLNKARAQALKAERDLNRIRPLYEQNAASQLDLDNAIAAYESAAADVKVSEADLTQAEMTLGYTTVRSPISGYISERSADIGTLVGPGGQSLLATVVKSDTVRVDFSMTALDYLRSKARNVNLGHKDSTRKWDPYITVTLADDSQYPFRGLVDFADPQVDPRTGTFSVRAEMPNPEHVLLPGQFTKVKLLLDVRENAVVVPSKALVIEKGGAYLFVVRPDSIVEKRFVETGPELGNSIVIERGLVQGEDIVTEGYHKLSHGMKVQPAREAVRKETEKEEEPMKLDFFIDRPVFSTVLSTVIVIVGIVGLVLLPVDQYPQIVPPVVKVSASYPGANAQTVTQAVATPIEQELNGTPGMIYMESSSSNSGSFSATVTFDISTDPDLAAVDIQNRLKQAESRLPAEVVQNGISVEKQASSKLMTITLLSSDPKFDEIYLSNYATLNVLDMLRRIPGVGSVSNVGSRYYAMQIWVQPDKLANLGLTVSDLQAALKDQNRESAAGVLGQAPMEGVDITIPITAQGRLSSVSQFEEIVIRANPDGSIIRLRDVARISLEASSYNTESGINGGNAAVLNINMLPGANAMQVAESVRETMEEISLSFPEGISYNIPFDMTTYISESIHHVYRTLFEALLLVILVVYLSLQSWRATIIPVVAVPISLIGTFGVMMLFGFSLNMLTLLGLILAIGIVVDDAIVVVENVDRIMHEEHLPAREATKKAMKNLGGALIAMSLVLCAVFVPVSFLSGITGQLYRQFTITIAVSVVISTIVALTLSPVMCSLFLKPGSGRKNRFFRRINFGLATGNRFYGRMIRASLKHSRRMFTAFGIIMVGIWMMNRLVPSSFMPQEDQGYFTVELELPEGATIERTREVTDRAMAFLTAEPDVQYVLNVTGSSARVGTNQARSLLTVILKPWNERQSERIDEVMNRVRTELSRYPESKVYLSTPAVIPGLGSSGGFEMVLEARGSMTYEELQRAVDTLMHYAGQRPELTGLASSMQGDIPQLYFDVDRDKAQMQGVTLSDIFSTMKAFTGSIYVNDFNMFNRIYRVYIQAEAPYRAYRDNLNLFFVRGSNGTMIPVTSLGTTDYTTGPGTIKRFNMFNSATVTGEAAHGYSSGQAMKALEEVVHEHLPPSVGVEWSGLSYQEKHEGGKTGFVLALAFLFVFLFLAAQYESWWIPVAVLLSLPVAGIGAYMGIWLCGLENNVYFQIGLVMLVGLVAKNAILIVEFAKEAVEKGQDTVTAALTAAHLRFRPIVMTSLAFILGLLPLVFASGPGSASRQGIGTGVFFGMLVAITVGIVFVPFFFVWIYRIKAKLKR